MSVVDLCLRNGKIPNRGAISEAGVAIEGGKIASVSRGSLLPEADKTVDLGGSLLLPGLVDPHVHFRDPGLTQKEDFSSGSKAAAAGGVTTVCDMPNTSPPTDSLDNFKRKREIAESKSRVDFGLHGMLSELTEEGRRLLDAGATSLKLYPDLHDDSEVKKFRDKNAVITAHPEDPNLLGDEDSVGKDIGAFLQSRPKEAEASEIGKLLNFTSGPHLHLCHVTTLESIELIARGRVSRISCEVTPHHLLLGRSQLRELGPISKTYPPLRSKEDRLSLLRALERGVVDIVATDHAPHTLEEKRKDLGEAPPGIAGIETSLPLLFTMVQNGKLSLFRLVEAMCSSPASLFGLRNDEGVLKGTLSPGADADLVALDQKREWRIKGEKLHGKTKFTPFENRKVVGKPFLTLVRGEIMFQNGEIVGREGHGKFIPRKA